jgi:hypothetical protein
MEMYTGNVCIPSPKDARNYVHIGDLAGALPETFDIPYTDIFHQRKIGVCTAASIIQQANRHFNTKFSVDFQYYMQKLMFDGNWNEGSSLLAELTIVNNYGLLALKHFPSIIDEFPNITYDEYISVLKERIEPQIDILKAFAAQNKIKGYASVKIDDDSIMQGIYTSSEGILVRLEVTKAYWTALNGLSSWKYEDISPIQYYPPVISGHAASFTGYDFISKKLATICNTWSTSWGKNGTAQIDLSISQTRPTEAWVVYWNEIPPTVIIPTKKFTYVFTKNLKFGERSYEVKQLQNALVSLGYMYENTGFYGNVTASALKKFQQSRGIFSDGKNFGVLSRLAMNYKLS